MRLIPLASLSGDDIDEWTRLGVEAVEPNPFFEPAFVRTAASALGADGVQLLVCEEAGTWQACMPVEAKRVLGRTVFLSTWKHPYCFVGTPLVSPGGAERFAGELVRSILAADPSRFVMVRRASEGPVIEAIRAAVDASDSLETVFERSLERAALVRKDKPDDYLSGMKSKRRSELRRLRRKLGEELGEEPRTVDRDDTATAAEEFLRLEASGWKGEQGTALASQESSAALFRGICAELGDQRLRIRSFEAGERVMAMTCDLVAGGVSFGFKAAYDERLQRYSPGIQLQIDNFMNFHARESETMIDSCGEPSNEAMNALWPDRRSIVTFALGRRGPSSRLLRRGLDASLTWKARRESSRADAD